jgi:hypothetical protein
LRPILAVPKGYNPKAMGLFLATYWRKYLITKEQNYLKRVRFFVDWLLKNVSKSYSGACWGYNFDWPSRGFFAPAGTPTIVNTAFNSLAFLDLSALPKSAKAANWEDLPLQTARSACEFILRDLNARTPAVDERCFSYTPLDHRYVHNANVLGAWLLAEVGAQSMESELTTAALEAARYTARRQRADGSWPYGEGPGDEWTDNFHTGYVLLALSRIAKRLSTNEFKYAIQRGYAYWKDTMFLANGTPKYYAHSTYPIDPHCAACAVLTFLEFADIDPDACNWAVRVALWCIEHLQDQQGYFHYQIHPIYRIRIPYMRWTQAWMQRALTELAMNCEGFNYENC